MKPQDDELTTFQCFLVIFMIIITLIIIVIACVVGFQMIFIEKQYDLLGVIIPSALLGIALGVGRR